METRNDDKKRILVVDPDEDFCKSVRLYLEESYQVTSRQGLEYIDYTLLLKQTDILVIDADQADRNFSSRLAGIRANHPEIKIVVMYTYFSTNKQDEILLARTADDLIAKPFDVSTLRDKLENLLPLTA